MPLSTWKSGLACFMQMFYFISNQHCHPGRYKDKIIKCTFQVKKDSAYSAVNCTITVTFAYYTVCEAKKNVYLKKKKKNIKKIRVNLAIKKINGVKMGLR